MQTRPSIVRALSALALIASFTLACGVAQVGDTVASPPAPHRAGESASADRTAAKAWKFPACEGVDAVAVIGPPPEPGSAADKADMDTVLFCQESRNAMSEEQAWIGVTIDIAFFNRALGARYERDWYPRLTDLVNDGMKDAKKVVDAAKRVFKRPRPYQADARVKPCIPLEDSFSYPSGHALRACVIARLLADLVPERTDKLLDYGRRCGMSRVMGGVHYPTDITSSFKLGEAVANAIIGSPEWKARKAELQQELGELKQSATWGGNKPRGSGQM